MTDMEMRLGLSQSLQSLVHRSFDTAKRAGSLTFSDTELITIRTQKGIPFQLRYCPALAKKPGAAPKAENEGHTKPRFDPFENPPAELLVAELPHASPAYNVVLNKYPVINNHFILATKTSKPQTDLLEESDLSTTYACLKAWRPKSETNSSGQLFAFFNSGEHSGASQAHRHLQFLPVEDMRGSAKDDWTLLIDQEVARAESGAPIYQTPLLPFVHFGTNIEKSITPQELYNRYISLLKASVAAVQRSANGSSEKDQILFHQDNEPLISYNLAMTLNRMAICPRRNGTAAVALAGADSAISINGTILGGTLMVKDEREWKALQEDPGLLDHILTTVGLPSTSSDEAKL